MSVRINLNPTAQNVLTMEDAIVNLRRIGVFQKNSLERNLNFMRIAHENVLSRESVIREADTATKMAKFTRNQILMNSQVAMLARASQPPMAMLQLFNQ
jgi:flagellin